MENQSKNKKTFLERIASKIPDPVLLFILLFAALFVVTCFVGGTAFQYPGIDKATGKAIMVTQHIKNMSDAENVQWIFNNAIVQNWLAYAKGLVGILLVAMFGIGLAEGSGLFSVLMKLAGRHVNERLLPYVIVFAGIMSNIASDAGYIVLIPLAGALYYAMGKNPLIGIAASFAGVSAGFGANLIPATPTDLLVGLPAKEWAVSQGIPWVSRLGQPLNEATMDYFYMCSLVFLFTFLGGWITNKFIVPKLSKDTWVTTDDSQIGEFEVKTEEVRDLRWAGLGLAIALGLTSWIALGPLKGCFARNIIIFVAFAFFMTGLFYGIARGKFRAVHDVVSAMTNQVKNSAYMLVLTFFCMNFLAMLSYSGVGSYVTYVGAKALISLNIGSSPVLLVFCFIMLASLVNLCVASMSAKWLLLGPIFIPMLYQVNPSITPEVVAAAYRTADPCTNIITPAMTYAGIILLFCRRYKPQFTLGELGLMMMPYALIFLTCATTLCLVWFKCGIPFGF
jgi:aminobenzoyl-glutamate transport protein